MITQNVSTQFMRDMLCMWDQEIEVAINLPYFWLFPGIHTYEPVVDVMPLQMYYPVVDSRQLSAVWFQDDVPHYEEPDFDWYSEE